MKTHSAIEATTPFFIMTELTQHTQFIFHPDISYISECQAGDL